MTLFLLILTLQLSAWANPPVVIDNSLQPEIRHERAALIVTHIIDKYHYRKKSLDDDLSSHILDN